ncbi:Death-associated protein kinase 2 isoform X1 [Oopsacas minuta]|uniref:Death-associated protein kinase 2 isoform X1 n=1 Tax=Oopsacas minuta TaxID=111878 RepID=A0AAV7KHY1_9METZ|nr:Death-associated protein kinase 2 isoform X1 [Oopsacas minuta]
MLTDIYRKSNHEVNNPKMAAEFVKGNFSENYILGKSLGKGNCGFVYECTELETKRIFAVKFVAKGNGSTSKQLRELSMEIRILKLVQHPNIVQLYDVYESIKELHLITELLSGGSLVDYLTEKEYFTERESAVYIHQLVSTLSYLHSNQIVHQDIKLDNIVINNRNEQLSIKIIDFGIARLCNGSLEYLSVEGTTIYSPPEVLSYEVTDYSRDMWSVGVCTYTLLSGYFPFESETDSKLMQEIIKMNYEFTEEFEYLSKEVVDFIRNLLKRERKDRLSAKSALEHPWLRNIEYIPETKIDTNRIKKLRAKMRWKSSYTALSVAITLKRQREYSLQ